jgi:hypothetical protein
MVMKDYHFSTEIDMLLKALVDTDRLRIIASLTQNAKSPKFLVSELHIKPGKINKHHALLEKANLVSKNMVEGDLVFIFNHKHLEAFAREVFSSPQKELDLSSTDLSRAQKEIINNYFDFYGRLKLIPKQRKKIIAICRYLVEAFKIQVDYSEKEINGILSRYHQDATTLRRYLVDH